MSRAIGYARALRVLQRLAAVDDRTLDGTEAAINANQCYTAEMNDRSAADSARLICHSAGAVVNYSGSRAGSKSVRTNGKARRGLSRIYLDKGEADHLPIALPRLRRRRIMFGWYGGKFNHLEWLLPLLPEAHHYCEPFAGSGAVLLNREPSPVETYNDVDGEVVNFFRVLRDQGTQLERAIALTPFSREEFHRAIAGSTQDLSDLERARRFYVRARQTRTGLAQTATLGRWANCKDTSRAGMSGVISRWLGGVEALSDVAERVLRVQIENRPAVDVIRLYDGRNTLFYCDPPYLHTTRGEGRLSFLQRAANGY
jgi:DNA adenine methylase